LLEKKNSPLKSCCIFPIVEFLGKNCEKQHILHDIKVIKTKTKNSLKEKKKNCILVDFFKNSPRIIKKKKERKAWIAKIG
jgi:hypothetical protein